MKDLMFHTGNGSHEIRSGLRRTFPRGIYRVDEMPTGGEGEWIELTSVDDPDIVVRLDLTSYGQYLNDRVLQHIDVGAAVS